jgi:hypothetical protein
MAVDEGRILLRVDTGDAVYPVEIDPLITLLEATLDPPHAQADQDFGYAVDLVGDLAIVGAPDFDGGPGVDETDSGAAYIFELRGWSWLLEAELEPDSPPDGNDNFGRAVSLEVDRAVVGAPGDDDAGNGAGAVYIFELVADAWTQVDKLSPADPEMLSGFGQTVSLSDTRLAVGAPQRDDDRGPVTISGCGAVHIFELDAGTWTEVEMLYAPDKSEFDQFGYPLSLDGDRFATTALYHDGAGNNAGAVYIYDRDRSGTWEYTQTLIGSDVDNGDEFGLSISLDGDRVLVGESQEKDRTKSLA